MSKEQFIFEKKIYLKDINLYGTAYFARYFEWQGEAREEFFKSAVSDYITFLNSGIILITKAASMEYIHEVKALDTLIIVITIGNVTRASFEMIFAYKNKKNDTVLAKGKQKILFANKDGKIIPIPDIIKEVGRKYLNPVQKAFLKLT